jgi:hypothetical protein
MNARERTLRALEFDGPDRAPRELWVLPWAEIHHPSELEAIRNDFPADLTAASGFYRTPPNTKGAQHKVGIYRDEWGCEFVNIQDGAMGEVKNPLVQDWENDVEKVRFPEEWLTFDREEVNSFCRSEERFVRAACCPRPFERLQFLRGSLNLYLDLAQPPPGFLAFLERLHAFYCELLEAWAKTEVDGLMMMDDWGSQRSLLISPLLWRTTFKPLYKDYIDIAHRHGKKMFMHSDGYILDIVGDLVELGLDALNSQVFCMGTDSLSAFRGKICFWGEIDRQQILPEGSIEEVRRAVTLFHNTLSHHGGEIAQCEFGLAAKPENIREVFQTWDRISS